MDSLRGAPDACANEFGGGHEVVRIFVVAGGDDPELLDPVKEAFDEIALAVEPWREAEALLTVGAIGNVGPHTSGGGGVADGVAVITLVAQQGGAVRDAGDQRFGLAGIVNLAAGQPQADRTSLSVDKSMEFACKAAPGTSHAMIARSPFFAVAPCWWTRTQVESIITSSPLKPAETAASSRSQTPALRQRTNRL